MRTVLTLLKMLKKEREFWDDLSLGLCSLCLWMAAGSGSGQSISQEEYDLITKILVKHKPKNAMVNVHWFSGGEERTKFLEKLIKRYSK